MNKRILKKRTRQGFYPQITYLLEEYPLKDILHSSRKDPVNSWNPLLQYTVNKNNRVVVLNKITSQKVYEKQLTHLYHKVHHVIYYVMFPKSMTSVVLTSSAHHYLEHLFHHMSFRSLLLYVYLVWDLRKDCSFNLNKVYHKWIKRIKLDKQLHGNKV